MEENNTEDGLAGREGNELCGVGLSSTATGDEFLPKPEEGRHLELMCNEKPLLGLGKSILKWFVLF